MKQKKLLKIHVKVGDNIKVISGKDKGKIGVVKTVLRKQNKVIIEGVNIKIKHIKPNRQGETGEIKQIEFPIHSSNVSKYEE
ncbi:unnamed protein product [Chrysoparadoxa australica]